MTPEKLDELEAALAKATPTESQVRHEPTDYAEERFTVRGVPCGFPVATFGDHHDADLFVLMKDFLRAELSAIRELRAEVERLREVVNVMGTAMDTADRLIERGYGWDKPRDWEIEWQAVVKARANLNPTGDAA